jgi:hypothetical protein
MSIIINGNVVYGPRLEPTVMGNSTWAATTDGSWDYPNGDPSLPI